MRSSPGEDALEKLRAGMTVEIRGSHDYLLPDVVKAINSLPVIPTTLTVCTDDVFPDHLVEKGGVSDVLRRLIRYGLDPLQAIRCATINNAIRLRRDDLGMVAAGRRADLVVLADLTEIAVETVYVAGRRVAVNGRMLEAPKATVAPPSVDTMKLGPLSADDFASAFPASAHGRAVVRTIKGARFNSWSEIEVEVRDGFAVVPGARQRHDGCAPPWPQRSRAADRHHRRLGSLARRLCQLVLARLPQSRRLRRQPGRDGARRQYGDRDGRRHRGGEARPASSPGIAYPVAGLLSTKVPAEVAREHKRVVDAAGEICTWQPPYRTFKALEGQSLACNPGPHLTDQGLTDGGTKEIRGILVE